MLQPFRRRLQQHVARWPWRRAGLLAGISFLLALMLVVYLFGVSDHFFWSTFFRVSRIRLAAVGHLPGRRTVRDLGYGQLVRAGLGRSIDAGGARPATGHGNHGNA